MTTTTTVLPRAQDLTTDELVVIALANGFDEAHLTAMHADLDKRFHGELRSRLTTVLHRMFCRGELTLDTRTPCNTGTCQHDHDTGGAT